MKKKYFFDSLKKFGDKTAIITENERKFSYFDLSLYIEKLLKIFNKKRNLVFLISNNSLEFIFSYYALLKAREIVFLIDNNLNTSSILKLIKIYKPDFIFDTQNKINNELFYYDIIKKIEKLRVFKTKKKIKTKFDSRLAQLISTSGSTGSPKFVKHSYDNIFVNTKDIVKKLKIKKRDVLITTMQPNYTYGLSKINTHISVGATVVLNNHSIFNREFWTKLNKFKITNFGGVPFLFEMIKKLNIGKFNLKSIKYLTQAGGKLDINTSSYFYNLLSNKKIKFFIMYGQTEATARITILDHNDFEKKIASIGKPIGNYKLSIKKIKKNKERNKKQIGYLMCKGRNVMLGYANKRSDLSKKKEIKILNTGDLAYKDGDGFFYIVGRSKRIIKPFGFRINLSEIEDLLIKKGYQKCACIGNDYRVNIYLQKFNIEEIKKLVFEQFNLKKDIIYVYNFKEIPRDNNGKIIYKI